MQSKARPNEIQNTELGTIQVYREYKPRDDAVEFTVFFRREGVKYRHDSMVTAKELNEITAKSPDPESTISDIIMKRIRLGEFVRAVDAIKPEGQGNITTLDHSTVELQKHNASDQDVAFAAWVSNFAADAKTRDTTNIVKLIEFLYNNKHMSPFEHGSFTWFIDTQLFVAREFMRHRTFSYNETSGRYKELEGRFYLPPMERPLVQKGKVGSYTFEPGTPEMYAELVKDHTEAFEVCWNKYQKGLKMGVAKEIARNVLPLGLHTQFYATANPRNVMQFLILRNDKHALYEIRDVAKAMEKDFAAAMPLTYAAFDAQRAVWEKVQRLLELVDVDALLDDLEGDN